ncbi:hypothetical protein ACFQI7_28145 [Paenibacillus allorhizosphaerae]|uniref:Uncharacterized protein n=1 Tax=Paenibacillus allorhizosphaerae TaxID=2849866 RepID=A0ABM8VNM2_9BACL|nr:hypothetical protein [Paenibacillus allorhizosphaerae]CAG7651510.1 hypothetical protein PAECIP111802_04982 [Paenibacillus allorhizosphaerae]
MWHIEIPTAYVLLSGVGMIIAIPFIFAGLLSWYWSGVRRRSEMASTIVDLETRISWYRNNTTENRMFEIQKPTIRRSIKEVEFNDTESQVVAGPIIATQSENLIETSISSDPAGNERNVDYGQQSQAFLDALKKEQEEHDKLEQQQLELDTEEQTTSTESLVFSPPKITEMQFAAEASPEFLKKLGIFTQSPAPKSSNNVIQFPTVARTPKENMEQMELELHLEDGSAGERKGTYWGHYRIVERYDDGLASCMNIETGDRGIFHHAMLARIDSSQEVFTALVQYKNNSRQVLGLWPGQHDISPNFDIYQEAMGG